MYDQGHSILPKKKISVFTVIAIVIFVTICLATIALLVLYVRFGPTVIDQVISFFK
jgi:hypothetical protein